MPRFRYRTVALDGRVAAGETEAESETVLRERLRADGCLLLECAAAGSDGLAGWLQRDVGLMRRAPTADELAATTEGLAALLAAGLPLIEALGMLSGLERRPRTRAVLGELVEGVGSGSSLSAAMRAHPRVFPAVYVGMVEAGEASGQLAAVLERLAGVLRRSAETRSKVRVALVYPAVLLFTSAAAIALLVFWVLPEFAPYFAAGGGSLPWPTRVVLGAVEHARSLGAAMVLLLAAGVFVGWQVRRDGELGARLDDLRLGLPLLGPWLAEAEAARVARVLGSLVDNGVALLPATELTRRAVGSPGLRRAWPALAEGLRAGTPLSTLFERTHPVLGLLAPLARLGESTGRMGESLLRAATLLETRVRSAADRLVAWLVPIITLVMGGVIAFVMLAIFGAVFEVNRLA